MSFKNKFKNRLFISVLTYGLLVSGISQAQTASTNELKKTNTLDKIKKSGVITFGHRESSIPFSYYDDDQKVIGYSQEYTMAIVDAVKHKLNMPNLVVKSMPITSQNRLPLLQNGTFDFECGSTTNNLERQKQADFSNTIFIVGTRLLTKEGVDDKKNIKSFDDLKGRRVVTTAGTTSEVILNKLNQEEKLNMKIFSVKDHGDAFNELRVGRADAFMMDDALLAGERAKYKGPIKFVIVGKPRSEEAYGCMLRKGDDEFKQLVDHAISDAQTSGKAAKWYSKWFENPIPPKGMNLHFPMNESQKNLFNNPNDKAIVN